MIWIRSAIYNVWFIGATVGLGLFGVGVRMWAPQHSLWLAQLWARSLLGGARLICGVRIEVIGRENLPEGPLLIASQHQSAFDTFVWLLLVPRVSYVYKAELSRIPLVGPLLRMSGQIMLDRRAGFAAIKALLRGAERAVADGRQIVIFPEGTRVEHGVEAPMRPGIAALAARTGLPVIPVATDSGRLWGREAFIKRPGVVHIAIGRPLQPGLGQVALLAALRAAWGEGEARMSACG
jgi:1-acyl-sn-glycerol-3-phosphate acyltransferase